MAARTAPHASRAATPIAGRQAGPAPPAPTPTRRSSPPTLELLAEVGVAGLSMDVLAQRAGVGKATIYRRWASKEALILDALRTTKRRSPCPTRDTSAATCSPTPTAVVERFAPDPGAPTCCLT